MSPLGIDINLDKYLAEKVLKTYPINVYPSGVKAPVGTFSQQNRLTNSGNYGFD